MQAQPIKELGAAGKGYCPLVHCDMSYPLPDPLVTATRERRGGQAVFAGTRVPVQTLFDYLVEENGLADFLAEFPEISREHVAAVLRLAREKAFPEPQEDPQKAT